MDLRGVFTPDREEYYLGDPIGVTLNIHNQTDEEVYLFVPRGRADGVRIAIKEGQNVLIRGMSEEPEPGLVPEERLPPGETYRQRYLLTRWLFFKEPGHYTIECAIQVESYNVSLRQVVVERIGTNVDMSTDVRFTILARTEQPTEGER